MKLHQHGKSGGVTELTREKGTPERKTVRAKRTVHAKWIKKDAGVVRGKPLGRSQPVGGGEDSTVKRTREDRLSRQPEYKPT